MLPAILPVVQSMQDSDDRDYVQGIYEKYRGKMYGVAYSILRQKEESEDCVQDVMRKVVENVERFKVDDEIYLESLLYISTKNTALDRYRQEYTKRKSETSIENFAEEDDAWDKIGIPCTEKSFDEILIDEENKKVLSECISELKDIYKETLILRYFHYLKFDEIAKILNINVSAAKQRVERAKKILYNMLKDRM